MCALGLKHRPLHTHVFCGLRLVTLLPISDQSSTFFSILRFAAILVVGGAIFSWLEKDQEITDREVLADFVARANESLPDREFKEMLHLLGVTSQSLASHAPHNWDFVGSCFFCFTAMTTIGYGKYTPVTDGGKIFLILFACVSIPICVQAYIDISDTMLHLVVAAIGKRGGGQDSSLVNCAFQMFDADRSGLLDQDEVIRALEILGYDVRSTAESLRRFETQFTSVSQSHQSSSDPSTPELNLEEFHQLLRTISPDAEIKLERAIIKSRAVLLALAIFIAIVGLSILFFGLARRSVDWTYLDAFYFTVVTFTTIGFGDFSPDPHPFWFGATFVVICFFGLGMTATLIRASSDPEFSMASTLRGMLPRTWTRGRAFLMTAVPIIMHKSTEVQVESQTNELAPYPNSSTDL